jgi:pimeloyl-ACP methyl ester carboxylesterase
VLEKRREGLPFLLKNTRRLIDRDTLEKGVCGDYPAGFDPSVVRACAIEQIALGDSVPTGTFLDMCVNLPIIDPLAIRMPTLVLRSEYDGIATDEDLLEFFARLPNRDKQFIVSPSLGHSSILGLQRHRVWNALEAFLRA